MVVLSNFEKYTYQFNQLQETARAKASCDVDVALVTHGGPSTGACTSLGTIAQPQHHSSYTLTKPEAPSVAL